MPEIYYFGGDGETVDVDVVAAWASLPERHRKDAVLVCLKSSVIDWESKSMCFVRIETSSEMSDEDVREIANNFVQVIDVSVRTGRGVMVYRPKGKVFEDMCFKDQ